MQRFWEIIFGLERGFLSREGEFSLTFNPKWPWQDYVGAAVWNLALACTAAALILYVYRREGRSKPVRVTLGVIRALLLAFVIALLNRPVLTLGQSRVEPSVVAILIDDSVSMRVRDAALSENADPQTRLDAVVNVLTADDQRVLRELAKTHQLRMYRFDSNATPLASAPATQPLGSPPEGRASDEVQFVELLQKLEPVGQNTQVARSLRTVLDDLQGQRLAGIVIFSDGRDTPATPLAATLAALKDTSAKIYPVAVGTENDPTNLAVQSVSAQESAFKGDIVNVRATVRGSGFSSGHDVVVQLKDKKTGAQVIGPDGNPSEAIVAITGDAPVEAELQIKPEEVGTLDLIVEAKKEPGEIDEDDNVRTVQIAVLDAKISVLYVDGYPRWEYRYLKNEMIRDVTVDISCLLTSADPTFVQEGDKPITRFPESIEELMEYDVVLLGDVDPRQFSDAQLQLVQEFVAKKGGGFGMVAGPQFSPLAYRNTPIEPILPVGIQRVQPETSGTSITQGFRPVLTKEGANSSIFRFYADRAANEKYVAEQIPAIFWYCKGVTAKPGVAEVYATHPSDVGPDGRKAPVLVLGRFGAGRTLFSAIDDSWRWRFYTGESIFDTYWVQQLRYLARSKKLGQRRLTLTALRPSFELGEQVRVQMRVLDPQLLQQLPEQVRVDIHDASGQLIRQETLTRQEGSTDVYALSFTADRVGKFTLKLPPIAGGVEAMELPIDVNVPRLELVTPQVDRTAMARLAQETMGRQVELSKVASDLPRLIPSAEKKIPIETSQPLWDAPLAMVLFVLLITGEWLLRKVYGML